MNKKPELLPKFAIAERAQFRAAKDKSFFLLEVLSSDNQQIEIRFPGHYAHDFLAQVQNLVARFPKAPDHTQNNETEH